jgi:thymidylate synthase
MIHFEADDSTAMATKVYTSLEVQGVTDPSRNGTVLRFNEPISMTYRTPWNRANFTPGRDANPFFHIAEAMWMLAGRRDVKFLEYFNKGMAQYSDDGAIFNAAYGYRARHHFGFDQLAMVPELFEADPFTRQAVIQLWDPADLGKDTKDKACNMSMVFRTAGVRMDMTVFNRSNDLIFGGVTGANPVHFSYFLQWICDRLKFPMGYLTFVSNNAHIYTDVPHWERMDFQPPLQTPRAIELPLGSLKEIEKMCIRYFALDELLEPSDYNSLHLSRIVVPMLNLWRLRKNGEDYNYWLNMIACPALMICCYKWLERRDVGH